ncbi:MAG: hypothetical protein SGPRY_003951 [Prymnesium sp.]
MSNMLQNASNRKVEGTPRNFSTNMDRKTGGLLIILNFKTWLPVRCYHLLIKAHLPTRDKADSTIVPIWNTIHELVEDAEEGTLLMCDFDAEPKMELANNGRHATMADRQEPTQHILDNYNYHTLADAHAAATITASRNLPGLSTQDHRPRKLRLWERDKTAWTEYARALHENERLLDAVATYSLDRAAKLGNVLNKYGLCEAATQGDADHRCFAAKEREASAAHRSSQEN